MFCFVLRHHSWQAQGALKDAREWNRVSCLQGKCPIHCTISLTPRGVLLDYIFKQPFLLCRKLRLIELLPLECSWEHTLRTRGTPYPLCLLSKTCIIVNNFPSYPELWGDLSPFLKFKIIPNNFPDFRKPKIINLNNSEMQPLNTTGFYMHFK